MTLIPHDKSEIRFIPNELSDPSSFAGLDAFVENISGNGYYGGMRLLMVRLTEREEPYSCVYSCAFVTSHAERQERAVTSSVAAAPTCLLGESYWHHQILILLLVGHVQVLPQLLPAA